MRENRGGSELQRFCCFWSRHAVSPYGRWCWRSELCVSRHRKRRHEPTVLCCVRLSGAQCRKKNPAWLGSAQLCSARLSSARLCSARLSSALLSSARLGLAQPGLAHLPFCLNRLMEVQVRAGRLQWKMKLKETAGLLG